MAGSAIGTALYTGQQTVGGGYKSGEVLRPCGSQTPDDASGQYDKVQAGAEADTPLLEEEIVRDGQREKWQEGMPQGGHCWMVSGRRREQTEAESE